jgi:hypothetical protein
VLTELDVSYVIGLGDLTKKFLFAFALAVVLMSTAMADWSTPVNVSDNSGFSYSPAIAVDSGNNLHAIWQDNTPGNWDIFYSKSTNGGATWSVTVNVSNNAGDSWYPAIATDSGNNLHVVWGDNTPGNWEIIYSKSTDGGATWSAAVDVSNNSGISSSPTIVVGSGNSLHVVWYDTPSGGGNPDILYSKSTDGGATWSAVVNISNNSGGSFSPAIIVDSGNNLHVVWTDTTPGNYDIFYSKSTDGGATWSAAVDVSNTSGESQYSAIAIDSGNNLHVVWRDDTPGNYETFYSKSTDGGVTWSAAVNISNDSGHSYYPAIAIDSGTIHIAWEDDTGQSGGPLPPAPAEIFYSKSTDGGVTWSAAVNISNNSGYSGNPAIATDSGNTLHAIWQDDTPGNYEILYSGNIASLPPAGGVVGGVGQVPESPLTIAAIFGLAILVLAAMMARKVED